MTDKKYPYAISYSQAIKIVQQYAGSVTLKTETVGLKHALNRYLAHVVSSPINVPVDDCSRMDGYAFSYDAYRNHSDGCFTLTEPQYAGDSDTEKFTRTNGLYAVPVMTGALLPDGTDTVVMKEHVTIDGGNIHLNQPVKKNQHLRRSGSDIKQGQMLLKKNHKISVADLGLLSSVGLQELSVYQRPNVALLMTGNELVSTDQVAPEKLQAGQVYESISLMLSELLQEMGCQVNILPTLKDDATMVETQLSEIAQKDYDLVVTVGGVSMGDRDLLPQVLADKGEVLFHKCLIKPGFPLLFGQLGQALYFGLPGNPVSAFVTCFEFIYPAILGMLHSDNHSLLSWRAEILQDLSKTHMKREFVRGHYNVNVNGGVEVMVCGDQQSSRIKSLSEANCFIVMNESQLELKRGQTVVIHPFNQLY
jgi:molybdopterin molybdotransferase